MKQNKIRTQIRCNDTRVRYLRNIHRPKIKHLSKKVLIPKNANYFTFWYKELKHFNKTRSQYIQRLPTLLRESAGAIIHISDNSADVLSSQWLHSRSRCNESTTAYLLSTVPYSQTRAELFARHSYTTS